MSPIQAIVVQIALDVMTSEEHLMAKMNKFFPCKCGHLLKDHDKNHKGLGCWNCSIIGHWYNCENGFDPDNLKFLELAASDLTKEI